MMVIKMTSKDIRNYIHNDLGIYKTQIYDMILGEIKKIVQEEVRHTLNDKQYLESLIEKEILRQIKGDKDYERRSFLISVMDGVYNRIDGIIHEEVLKRLQITLKETEE